ncbi:MAG: MCE family protein [Flavobacterium sp.]|nr:MCE family protein [Candidatus Neoflavobacterium equi]
MKLSREIKAAILVIGSILLFFWGYSFLKGQGLFDTTRKFYVVYDNVEGLSPSAAITVNGLTVGKVNGITIDESNGKLLVELLMTSDFQVPKNTVASIYEPGFIGGKQIALVPDFTDKNYAVDGDYLKADVILGLTASLGDKLAPIQIKVDSVLTGLDLTLKNVNNILDTKAQQDLKNTLSELNTTMTNFSSVSKNVDGLLVDNRTKITSAVANLDATTANFAKISSDLEKAQLDKLVSDLKTTLNNVNGLLAGIEAGNGTIGKLVKDDKMYNNLTKASKELELLLEDVRLNPTRYINVSVFGKKNKTYVAPAETSAE